MRTTRPAISLCLLLLLPAFLLSAQVGSQRQGNIGVASHPGPAIVSPEYPRDSRGETVYEEQGKEHQDQPAVAGELLPPMPIKTPAPKYPKSLKRAHAEKEVTVMGVIAGDGDFIDARIVETVEPDVEKSALDAVAQWKFHPATLSGKPVAERTKVVVGFRIY